MQERNTSEALGRQPKLVHAQKQNISVITSYVRGLSLEQFLLTVNTVQESG